MTVKDVLETAAPSCWHRREAIKICQREGVQAAIAWLATNGGNVETMKMIGTIDTRNPNAVLHDRNLQAGQ
jgi:hypothetical protein